MIACEMKSLTPKRQAKDHRENQVLLGLVELYLETGQPVGSVTLHKERFSNISSATIRNYFCKLEKAGLLRQQHSSGGRIPTEEAYQAYLQAFQDKPQASEKNIESLRAKLIKSTREVSAYLQKSAETVSEATQCAVFLSSPRFDQDFIFDIQLVGIDHYRCLCILLTDFGMVHTEIMHCEQGLVGLNLKNIAQYLQWRISGLEKPKLSPVEEKISSQFYKEIMLRHIVGYSNFSAEDIYKTGFSKLLNYPDLNNATSLANGLSLFENETDLRKLIHKACKEKKLCYFIGNNFEELSTKLSGCSVLVTPYKIHQSIAGAIAILGPNRIPYRSLIALLDTAQDSIGKTLTSSLYKFKITFRNPKPLQIELENQSKSFGLLLENKDKE